MTFIINSIPAVQPISLPVLRQQQIEASVLRLDAIHPVVSGNKWYKLKLYLADAKANNINVVVTFGGAYSNHIVATAAACAALGISSFGVIRGEAPSILSPTLLQARSFDMELFFTSREAYKVKEVPTALTQRLSNLPHTIIPEGGYGIQGAQGAATIFDGIDIKQYSHIISAVGTGTTLAGLAIAASATQKVIGISVLKSNFSLEAEMRNLLPTPEQQNVTILHDYHCGGYARYNAELLAFMNDWYRQTGVPSDFVYTGKLFFAFQQLCAAGYFPSRSKVLLIHSGGLQGNRSLPPGTLIFSSE